MFIFCECDNDVALLTGLGKTRKQRKHAGSKGEVCNLLKKSKNEIGIVDEDPGKSEPSYKKELSVISSNYDFKIYTDNKRGHILIEICPELEEWIIKIANKNHFNFSDYFLPDTPDKLREINDNQRKHLIKMIIDMTLRSQELQKLQKYL